MNECARIVNVVHQAAHYIHKSTNYLISEQLEAKMMDVEVILDIVVTV